MSDAFAKEARAQVMLDVEAALAEAEASLDVIPSAAAQPIRSAAYAELYDLPLIENEARRAGNFVIPLVRHLTKQVERGNAAAARYVHWGATSQDIIDTALVLQLRASVPVIAASLDRASAAAARHARRHAGTVMPGRTWLQQATPITFGLKAAGWMDALVRVRRQLNDALVHASVLQFGGASGTLAALGQRGPDVARALGERLQLAVPALPWHAHRDRMAGLACALGVVAGTLGKIARDLALLAQTEVAEAHAATTETGRSSTMPHKRNPVREAVAIAAAIRAPGFVATVLSAMPQEHERGLGGWQAEGDALPELVLAVLEASDAVAASLEHLVVDPERMKANLQITQGAIMAEAIAMRLAPGIGKSQAHARVDAAVERAAAEKRTLGDVLADDASVTGDLSPAEIAKALSPEQYLGATHTLITKALKHYDDERGGDR